MSDTSGSNRDRSSTSTDEGDARAPGDDGRGTDDGHGRLGEAHQPGLDQPLERGDEAVDDSRAAGSTAAAAGGELRQSSLWGDALHSLRRNPTFLISSAVLIILAVMAIRPQLFTSVDPQNCNLAMSRQAPSAQAWFGYDVQGCDYFTHVIYGARVSMIIGLFVVAGALLIGVTLGAMAGYYGGKLDTLISRIVDVAYGLPFILGAILILTVVTNRTIWIVGLALIVLSWMTPLRLVRSSVISVKQSDYVQASKALGTRTSRIITRHILPNAIAPVLVYGTIAVGGIIGAEASLAFLGVGLELPNISWGIQINVAQNWIRDAPHLVIFPGVFLSITVLAFLFIGDAIRDALDPKLR